MGRAGEVEVANDEAVTFLRGEAKQSDLWIRSRRRAFGKRDVAALIPRGRRG